MGCYCARSVREDAEDVTALAVIVALLLLTALAVLIPALAAAAHAGYRRGGAFLGITATGRGAAAAIPVRRVASAGAIRRATRRSARRRRSRARGRQPLVVDPVVCAAKRV